MIRDPGMTREAVAGMISSSPAPAHTHPISQVTGLQTALDGKYATPTGTAAQYLRGDGTLGTMPVAAVRTQSQVTRALNTVFQVSATRDAMVQYAVQCTVTSSIGSGQDGDVFLDIAADAAFTTSVQSVDVSPCSQVVTLAIALQSVQKGTVSVRGFVPAGYYARIRTVSYTGSPVFLYRLGQEVLQ